MMTPKQHAERSLNKFKTNDPFKIAKKMNIHMIFEDLEEIYGYFFKYKRSLFININNKLPERLQRYVCAHELGHAIQHQDQNTAYLSKHTLFSTDKLEVEANKYAVELLIPDSDIIEYINYGYTIDQISNAFGIPKEFMKYKKI